MRSFTYWLMTSDPPIHQAERQRVSAVIAEDVLVIRNSSPVSAKLQIGDLMNSLARDKAFRSIGPLLRCLVDQTSTGSLQNPGLVGLRRIAVALAICKPLAFLMEID